MTPDSSRGRRRRLAVTASALAVLAAAIVAVAAIAAPAGSTHKPATVTVAPSVQVGSAHEPIAVSARGRPVYDLVPETARHLLCTKASGCLAFWPPVTVAAGTKPVKGAGLKGRLGTFRRDGVTQVTLNGHPLYTFAGDHGVGVANGNGLKSFGGTWHVVVAGSAKAATAPGGSTGGGGGW